MRLLLCPAILATLLTSALPLEAQSQAGLGDLMIIPTRVVLEGRDRSATIMLRNAGRAASSYRIFFQEMRMLPSGQLEPMAKADDAISAADLVRYSPRQVELAPGEVQTVRIQMRKPEGLKDGEYRSHLVFQGLPPVQPASPVQIPDEKTIGFNITTLVALSIPVIVRQGETAATVSLGGLALLPPARNGEPPALELDLKRSGNRSVQGEFKVDWVPRSGRPRTVLPVAGGTIYAELDARRMHLVLADAKDLVLKGGQLKVTFSPKDSQQLPVVASLDLP
jgi:P pilus assembly chaperone PapD